MLQAQGALKGKLALATETLTQRDGSCDAQVDKLRADFADQMDQLDRCLACCMSDCFVMLVPCVVYNHR